MKNVYLESSNGVTCFPQLHLDCVEFVGNGRVVSYLQK